MFSYNWCESISESLRCQIKHMLVQSVEDNGVLGFSMESKDADFDKFISKLDDNLKNNANHLLIMNADNEIAGMCVLVPNLTSNCKHIVDITKAFILKKFRGREGVKGSYNEIIKKCLEHSYSLLTLDVRENSDAHKLWRLFGFVQYGRLENYAIVNGVSYSGIFMFQSTENFKI